MAFCNEEFDACCRYCNRYECLHHDSAISPCSVGERPCDVMSLSSCAMGDCTHRDTCSPQVPSRAIGAGPGMKLIHCILGLGRYRAIAMPTAGAIIYNLFEKELFHKIQTLFHNLCPHLYLPNISTHHRHRLCSDVSIYL